MKIRELAILLLPIPTACFVQLVGVHSHSFSRSSFLEEFVDLQAMTSLKGLTG